MPKTRFDPTDSSEEDFLRSFRASDSDCVRTLATSVNLGGQYAEEVCKRVGIDKSTPISQVDDGTVSRMYSVMKDIVGHVVADPEPTAFLKDGQIQDLAPIDMMSHEDLDKQRYESMSKLIDAFLVQIQEDEEEAFVDPRVEKLNKRIAKQEETLEEYREQCEVYRRKAEALYTDYAKVSELLSVLLEQSSRITWDKLREGASLSDAPSLSYRFRNCCSSGSPAGNTCTRQRSIVFSRRSFIEHHRVSQVTVGRFDLRVHHRHGGIILYKLFPCDVPIAVGTISRWTHHDLHIPVQKSDPTLRDRVRSQILILLNPDQGEEIGKGHVLFHIWKKDICGCNGAGAFQLVPQLVHGLFCITALCSKKIVEIFRPRVPKADGGMIREAVQIYHKFPFRMLGF